jgi:hypothetical protein
MHVKPRAGRRAQDNLSQRRIWILPATTGPSPDPTATPRALNPAYERNVRRSGAWATLPTKT